MTVLTWKLVIGALAAALIIGLTAYVESTKPAGHPLTERQKKALQSTRTIVP